MTAPQIVACAVCGDTGLMLGGWMGPTRDALWPRACECPRGQQMTPRAVQVAVIDLVTRDLYAAAAENRPAGERGWWVEKYARLLNVPGLFPACGEKPPDHTPEPIGPCELPEGHGHHHRSRNARGDIIEWYHITPNTIYTAPAP